MLIGVWQQPLTRLFQPPLSSDPACPKPLQGTRRTSSVEVFPNQPHPLKSLLKRSSKTSAEALSACWRWSFRREAPRVGPASRCWPGRVVRGGTGQTRDAPAEHRAGQAPARRSGTSTGIQPWDCCLLRSPVRLHSLG